MIKKKLTALGLALAMTVGLVQGVFAAEPKSEESIEDRIQARTEEMYDLVYGQLEAQNAVDMIDDFMEIFIPEIEFEVMQKYGMGIVPYGTNGNRIFMFTHGGAVRYRTESGNEILATYLDEGDTTSYLLQKNDITLREIFVGVMGEYFDGTAFGAWFKVISAIDIAVDLAVRNDIQSAGGYARIIAIEDPDAGPVVVTYGWYTYPTVTYSDSVEILHREFFPAN